MKKSKLGDQHNLIASYDNSNLIASPSAHMHERVIVVILSVCPFVCLSVCLSVFCLSSVCLSVYLSVCLSVSLSVCYTLVLEITDINL